MADDSKSFPASDLKLERLRQSGVTAFSQGTAHFAVLFGIITGALVFSFHGALELLSLFARVWGSAKVQVTGENGVFSLFAFETILAFAKILIPALICMLLIGLLQRKFLFSARLAAFDLSRIGFSGLAWSSIKSNFVSALSGITVVLIVIGVLGIAGAELLRAQLEMIANRAIVNSANSADLLQSSLSQEAAEILSHVSRQSLRGCAIIIALFALLAVIFRVAAVVRFNIATMMSRAEVEAEMRETEVSPETRSARKQAQQEFDT